MTDVTAKRFYGKYRGVVKDNKDPAGRGRLRVEVPGVQGLKETTWAEACVPLAGPIGFPMGVHLVPPKDTGVWVEFEAGDTNQPVWVGCIWSGKDGAGVPPQVKQGLSDSPSIVMQTSGQNSLVISDASGAPGGITLRAASGATITVNDQGITIRSAGGASIEVAGGTVKINQDALEVT